MTRLDTFAATCLVVGGSIARSWDPIEPLLAPPLRSAGLLVSIARAADLAEAALARAAS